MILILIRRTELQRDEPWGSGVESRCFILQKHTAATNVMGSRVVGAV